MSNILPNYESGDPKSLVYIESEAVEIHQLKMENRLQKRSVQVLKGLITNIEEHIKVEESKMAELQTSTGISRAKRDIIFSRHLFVIDLCRNEIERLYMQREEAISMTNQYHQDRDWYTSQSMIYDYFKEYQGATQKQKLKQRANNAFSRDLIDDMIDGSGDMPDLMKLRNSCIWHRHTLSSRIVSQGGVITDDEFRINNHELKGDVVSVIKSLQLVEYLCRRKSAQTMLTGEELDMNLLMECSKHIGYSMQFLRYLWNLLQEKLKEVVDTKNDTISYDDDQHTGDIPHESYNIEDDSLTGELDEELLFDHISSLMKQLFASLHALLRTSQAICRTPSSAYDESFTNINTAHTSRRTSLHTLYEESNISTIPWSWGCKYDFHISSTSSSSQDNSKYHHIVQLQSSSFTDEHMCQELLYWLIVFYQCKIKVKSSSYTSSSHASHHRSSIDILEGSFNSIHDTLTYRHHGNHHGSHHGRSHSRSYYSKRYDFLFQRMLYQGSPLMLDALSSCYYFIIYLTMNPSPSSSCDHMGFQLPPSYLKELMVISLALSEYMIKKVSLTMMTAHDIDGDCNSMGNIALTNLDLLRGIDDEIIISNQISSACFAAGIITSSSLDILETGLSFTHARRDNYFIQVSWINALMLAATCLMQGGWTEHEVNRLMKIQHDPNHHKPSSSASGMNIVDNYTDSDLYDTSSTSPRNRLVTLLHHQCSIRIIEVMNYHRHSLSIQYTGLLVLRILFRPAFMRRVDVENILSIADFDDMETILLRIKHGSKEEEDRYHDKMAEKIFADLIHMSVDDVDMHDDVANIRSKFMIWRNSMFQRELHVISNYKTDDFVTLVGHVSDMHMQYPELIEQILLLVYELSSTSSFAKHSFIESGLLNTIRRVPELHRGCHYLITLSELCIEVLEVS